MNSMSQKAGLVQPGKCVEYYTQSKKIRPKKGYDRIAAAPGPRRTLNNFISSENI